MDGVVSLWPVSGLFFCLCLALSPVLLLRLSFYCTLSMTMRFTKEFARSARYIVSTGPFLFLISSFAFHISLHIYEHLEYIWYINLSLIIFHHILFLSSIAISECGREAITNVYTSTRLRLGF